MFTRTRVTAGLAMVVAAGAIAAGPALSGALGADSASTATAAVLPASWESEQATNAARSADSHADVLARAEADEKERKRKAAAAKAKREAARKAKAKAAARAAARAALKGGTPAQNRALGMKMCADRGWSASQCSALDRLWQRESGWNHRAANRSSGAYGIPQALPGSKMGTVASDWRTNPATQIAWGLNYIQGRYGNPGNAWAHSQRVGWY